MTAGDTATITAMNAVTIAATAVTLSPPSGKRPVVAVVPVDAVVGVVVKASQAPRDSDPSVAGLPHLPDVQVATAAAIRGASHPIEVPHREAGVLAALPSSPRNHVVGVASVAA